MRFAAVVFLVLLLRPALAIATPLEDAQVAFANKDWQTIQNLLKPLADQANHGDIKAQMLLGKIYETGGTVTKDPPVAMKWFRMAADQGNVEAQMKVGFMYEAGEGVHQSRLEATEWYRKAADQGNADAMWEIGKLADDSAEALRWFRKAGAQGSQNAQLGLGLMFAEGIGVKKDFTEAFRWYLEAAEQGNFHAGFALAEMYEKGWGVKQDYVQAYMWYLIARERSPDTIAPYNLEKKMTPEQMAEGRRLAAQWNATHTPSPAPAEAPETK